MTLAELRLQLAEAKIALRLAKDAHDTSKAIAEQRAIERLNGNAGKNEAERTRNIAVELAYDLDYCGALGMLRDAEATIDRLNAQIAVEEDAIRAAELRARERLADALMGKRADDAAADAALTIVRRLVETSERHGTESDYHLAEMDGIIGSAYEALGRARCEQFSRAPHPADVATDTAEWYGR